MDPPSSPAPREWLTRLPAWAQRPLVLAGAAVTAVAMVLVVLAFVLWRPAAGPAPRLTLPVAGGAGEPGGVGGVSGATGATGAGGATGAALPGSPQSSGTVTVHAAGAVASPGIYAVPAGARVADVLTAAGGPLPEADLDRLNLAARVTDGERVHVARKGEPGADGGETGATAGSTGPGATAMAGPIDLNTATAAQLDTLPGVGPATAQAIITYRTRHGRFRSVTELLEVPGIGPAKLEALRPLVKV